MYSLAVVSAFACLRCAWMCFTEPKRLGHALALIKAQQDSHFEAKVKTNSEKGEYQKRGRQIYGPDYVPKVPAKSVVVADATAPFTPRKKHA